MKKSFFRAAFLGLAAVCFSSALLFSCANGSSDDDDSGSGSSSGTSSSSTDTTSLQKLNCLSTTAIASDGTITAFGDQTTAPSSSGGSWLVWGNPVTKSSSISMTATVLFSDNSKQNGIGFIVQNGTTCTAYALGSEVGVKNVDVAGNGDCLQSSKGNGYSFSGSYSLTSLIGTKIMEKVAVDNENMVFSFYTTDGTLMATKSVAFTTDWADDTKVYMAIGGFGTSLMTIYSVKVTESGTSYPISSLTDLALASLTLDNSAIRVSKGGTNTITATATKAGGDTTTVTAVSADTSVATVGDITSAGVITINGIASGSTTITITNVSDTTISKTCTVNVDAYASSDSYTLTTSDVYPNVGATDAPVDGYLRITFDSTPTLESGGCINIYTSDGTLADTVLFDDETLTAWTGTKLSVDDQLAYVSGDSVYFMPHYNALSYSTTYYVTVPVGAIAGTLNGVDFSTYGLTPTSKSWSFTTRSDPGTPSTSTAITVDSAEASTANYRTIQKALYTLSSATGTYTIDVAAGTYRELVYYKGTASVKIVGTVSSGTYGSDVVIQWTNGEKLNSGTHTRPSFYFGAAGCDLTLENVTLQNTYSRATYSGDAQAEAIYFANNTDTSTGLALGHLAAYNCSFKSHQDTIQTTGKAWFYKCYIEGDVDFLWGTAQTALFDTCKLVSLYDSNRGTGTLAQHLIVARTGVTGATYIGKGFVVDNSTLEIESGTTQYFGRDAGSGSFYDQAAIVNTVITEDTTGNLLSALWDTSTYLYLSGYASDVGWKDYGNTLSTGTDIESTYTSRASNTNVISSDTYSAEYSTASLILDRVYDTSTHAYVADPNDTWGASTSLFSTYQ